MTTYAYLVVDRAPRDWITYPDGSVSDHPRGEGQLAAEAWLRTRTTEPPSDSLDEAEHEYAAWEARLKAHLRETVWNISDRASREARYEAERAAFMERDPPPTGDARGVSGLVASSTSRAPELGERDFWHARLLTEPPPPARVLGACDESLPHAAIAGILTELAIEGWRVITVSHERSASVEADMSRTVIHTFAFLLARDLDARPSVP
jgi:hypothetical protein